MSPEFIQTVINTLVRVEELLTQCHISMNEGQIAGEAFGLLNGCINEMASRRDELQNMINEEENKQ